MNIQNYLGYRTTKTFYLLRTCILTFKTFSYSFQNINQRPRRWQLWEHFAMGATCAFSVLINMSTFSKVAIILSLVSAQLSHSLMKKSRALTSCYFMKFPQSVWSTMSNSVKWEPTLCPTLILIDVFFTSKWGTSASPCRCNSESYPQVKYWNVRFKPLITSILGSVKPGNIYCPLLFQELFLSVFGWQSTSEYPSSSTMISEAGLDIKFSS